jgi:hypothetical protein
MLNVARLESDIVNSPKSEFRIQSTFFSNVLLYKTRRYRRESAEAENIYYNFNPILI